MEKVKDIMAHESSKLSELVNYYFRYGMAFTEDDVPVYNLFFYKLWHKITLSEIYNYFANFGEILDVYIAPDCQAGRRRSSIAGFVNFVNPVDAADVLSKSFHQIYGKPFLVKACHSWNQPKLCMLNDGSGRLRSSIMALNDDCLMHICQQLNLSDQIRFARVCGRFQEVFRLLFKVEHSRFKLEHLTYMTLWEKRDLLQVCGPDIVAMSGVLPYKDRDCIFKYIMQFCTNLKKFCLLEINLKASTLRKLLRNCSTITELHLYDCWLTDSAVLAITQLPRLKALTLAENFELTGQSFDKFVNLIKLNIYGCRNILSHLFIAFCKTAKKLKYLDVRRCESLDSTAFAEMARYLLKLETLKMPLPVMDYTTITELKHLKHLELQPSTIETTLQQRLAFFNDFADRQAERLEVLKLFGNTLCPQFTESIARLSALRKLSCTSNITLNNISLKDFSGLTKLEYLTLHNIPDITDSGVLEILDACEHLKIVDVQHCPNITINLLYEAKRIIMRRKQRTDSPVKFYVFDTKITTATCAHIELDDYKAHFIVDFSNQDKIQAYDYELFDIGEIDPAIVKSCNTSDLEEEVDESPLGGD